MFVFFRDLDRRLALVDHNNFEVRESLLRQGVERAQQSEDLCGYT